MTEAEFRQRVMPLRTAMYAVALRIGIPPEEGADTVQEALLQLWRYRSHIPADESELRPYCMRVHRNGCLAVLKKQKLTVPIEEASGNEPEFSDETQSRDLRRHVELLISTLPRNQQAVIRLSGFGGLDNAEIAEVTGQTDNNVRQLLSRGRRRLRELLNTTNQRKDNG